MRPSRRRTIAATDPGGAPTCSLTAADAHAREAPIDRLLAEGTFESSERGYEIRLPRADSAWTLAGHFIEEEAICCPSFDFEVIEEGVSIVVRGSYTGDA